MKTLAALFLIIIVLLGSTVYFAIEKGELEEQLKTKDDAIAQRDRKLKLQAEAYEITLAQLERSKLENSAMDRRHHDEMRRLNAVLEGEKQKIPDFRRKIDALRAELAAADRSKAGSVKEKEALASALQAKEDEIRKLQNEQKSHECLKVELPGSALDELYGVRNEKGSEG